MNDLIRSYVTHLEASGRSENTIDDRRKLLQRLDRELPEGLDAFSTQDLEEWLAPFGGWTLYTYHTTIRDFGRFVVTVGHDFDPTADLVQPRMPDNEPHPATVEELDHALASLTGVALTAVIVAAYEGLRCAEIARLDRRHVTAEHVWTRRKGGKTQLLPTHEVMWEHIRGMPAGLVVRTQRGTRFSPSYLSQVVSTQLTRVGLPHLTAHRFRSTYATEMAAAGKPLSVIQDLMGHKSPVTTGRYIRVTDGQRRDAITALPVPASRQQEAA